MASNTNTDIKIDKKKTAEFFKKAMASFTANPASTPAGKYYSSGRNIMFVREHNCGENRYTRLVLFEYGGAGNQPPV